MNVHNIFRYGLLLALLLLPQFPASAKEKEFYNRRLTQEEGAKLLDEIRWVNQKCQTVTEIFENTDEDTIIYSDDFQTKKVLKNLFSKISEKASPLGSAHNVYDALLPYNSFASNDQKLLISFSYNSRLIEMEMEAMKLGEEIFDLAPQSLIGKYFYNLKECMSDRHKLYELFNSWSPQKLDELDIKYSFEYVLDHSELGKFKKELDLLQNINLSKFIIVFSSRMNISEYRDDFLDFRKRFCRNVEEYLKNILKLQDQISQARTKKQHSLIKKLEEELNINNGLLEKERHIRLTFALNTLEYMLYEQKVHNKDPRGSVCPGVHIVPPVDQDLEQWRQRHPNI